MDRKLPAKRTSNSDSSEDTRKGEIDAAAASLLASLKSSPSNKGSANPPRAAASAGIAAVVASDSASAASSKSSESEDDAQGEQKPTSMRHTSFDSRYMYECPCCQQVFLTAQTSWKKIQTHVTSCVDLNESIDSAKIMTSALVTKKTSPETPNLRASRKRRLAPKAAAAAAATAASEGKKKVPLTTTRKVTAANKVVKSSKNYSAKKKPPKPRPSNRCDRNASAISAASEKKKRAQDIQSILSSKELRQALNEMAMDGLDLFS